MLLMPQFLIPDVSALTDEFLKENGIRGIIFDIDNTLVGFRAPKPTPENLALFAPNSTCTRGQIVTILYRAYN